MRRFWRDFMAKWPVRRSRAEQRRDAARSRLWMRGKNTRALKNAASPPRSLFNMASPSRLRLRLQPGVRIGARARLAGGRHRRGARSGRLQHRLAVRLLALEQILNLVAGQGFEFKQALCQGFKIGTLLGQDLGRLIIAFFDQTPDLAVDLLNGRLGGILG